MSRGRAYGRGAAAAVAGAPLVYALARLFERGGGPVDDPAGVIWAERLAFFGRLTVVVFVVALAAPALGALARRWPPRAAGMFCALAVASTVATLAVCATER